MLAAAIPATTLPLGANPLEIDSFTGENIDMSHVFMTDAEVWPRYKKFENNGQIPSWFHFDYKDVPYVHTWKFYQKICDLLK